MAEYLLALIATLGLSFATLLGLKLLVSSAKSPSLKQLVTKDILHTTLSAGILSFAPLTFILQGDGKKFKIDLVIFIALVAVRFVMMRSAGSWQRPEPDSGLANHLLGFCTSWAGPIILGVTYGFLATIGRWWGNTFWLTDRPSDAEARWYLWFFLGLFVASIVGFMILRRRKLIKTVESFKMRQAINRAYFLPALFGIFIALVQDQTRNLTFANRYFTLTIFAIIIVVSLWYAVMLLPGWRSRLEAEQMERAAETKHKRKKANTKRKKR